MRTRVSGHVPWVRIGSALLAFLWLPFSSTLADESAGSSPSSTPAAALPAESEAMLVRALELERQRNWLGAIELYDKALEQWPSRTEFSHRRRLCETHYRIVRRYQDQSFRNVLLRLRRDQAARLYGELLERIETHYVDSVEYLPLVRKGLDNMEVALRDPNFLALNAPRATPESVTRLRDSLRSQRARLALPQSAPTTRLAAEAEALGACDRAHALIDINEAAVILEFTYGACDALDDYTSYLTPDKLDDLYAMIDGNFVGLGVELKQDAEGLKIVGVIRGGPAFEAGVKAGDIITHVGDQAMKGLSLDEAANRLQGTEGTLVTVTVRSGSATSRSYRLTRRHVEVESVANAHIVDSSTGTAYVQLTGFQKSSTEELEKALTALRKQGMRSLVLDLRGNPGGLLNIAVEMGERFIDKGVIVSTRGRAPGQSQVYRANARAVWTMPLYVLIDHDSASASEILAGALKDHHRAVVLGERSYGKGSVQSIFALRSAPAGLKLTTAKFYSPLSRPYSEQGVDPDIQVQVTAKPAADSPEPAPEAHFGDPAQDPVLAMALRHARGQLNAAR
jgi:carboxyl-terminal processing protease